jgi:hypothetical protein
MSSRNLRNMIQVSRGRRSRSPLRPLSLRMICRADLMREPSRWAVVIGGPAFFWRVVFFVAGVLGMSVSVYAA